MLGLVLVLVLRFCALKLITSNERIAHGVPSFELVRRRKYVNIANRLLLQLG